jgi:chromate transporter
MAPITIGLMLAGVHAVGKTACINSERPLDFNITASIIALAVAGILFAKHINPVLLMLLGGGVGWFLLRVG